MPIRATTKPDRPPFTRITKYAVLVLSLTLPFSRCEERTRESCENATKALLKVNEGLLETAESAFFGKFTELCEAADSASEGGVCENETLNPELTVRVSYDALAETSEYGAFVDACEAKNGTICTVDEEPSPTEAVKLSVFSRPVCVPSSCGEEEYLDLYEPPANLYEPSTCDNSTDCVSIPIIPTMTCPAPKVSGDDCAVDVASMKDDVAILQAENSLSEMIDESCWSGETEQDDICEYSTSPMKVLMTLHFDRLTSDETYATFRNACETSGGSICTSNVNFTRTVDMLVFELDSTSVINGIPVCFAKGSCTEAQSFEMIKEKLTMDMFPAPEIEITTRRLFGENNGQNGTGGMESVPGMFNASEGMGNLSGLLDTALSGFLNLTEELGSFLEDTEKDTSESLRTLCEVEGSDCHFEFYNYKCGDLDTESGSDFDEEIAQTTNNTDTSSKEPNKGIEPPGTGSDSDEEIAQTTNNTDTSSKEPNKGIEPPGTGSDSDEEIAQTTNNTDTSFKEPNKGSEPPGTGSDSDEEIAQTTNNTDASSKEPNKGSELPPDTLSEEPNKDKEPPGTESSQERASPNIRVLLWKSLSTVLVISYFSL